MKKHISFLTAILIVFISMNTFAQVSLYDFSQSAGVYTEIAGDTIVDIATETTGPLSMDDALYPNNSLPFTFFFNGVAYDNFVISTSGFITFGSVLPNLTERSVISGTGLYDGAIALFSRDMIGNRGITGNRVSGTNTLTSVAGIYFVGLEVGKAITGTGIPAGTVITALDSAGGIITLSQNLTSTGNNGTSISATGSIVRGTTGSVGSRVHTVQFRNIRPYNTGSNNNLINMQVKLYEGTNDIEIVYGLVTNSLAASTTGQVGLRGASNSDFNNRTAANSGWDTTSRGTANNNTVIMNVNSLPVLGTTFMWSVPPDCQMVIENINPTGVLTPGCNPVNIAPQVRVWNNGFMDQSNISVRYQVAAAGYDETVSGINLNINADTLIDFPGTLNIDPDFPGTKNVTITAVSVCNGNPDTNTAVTTYDVSTVNYNFGGPVAGYFWTNSSPAASCAPDQPIFHWVDTTGSTSLILDRLNASGSLLVGTVNDGYYALGNVLPAGHFFKYMGVDYDSFYVSTNGLVLFSRANNTQAEINTTVPKDIPAATSPRPAIFPFWYNLNFTDTSVPENRLSYKYSDDRLIITYDRAPVFLADAEDYISFQIILETPFAPTEDGKIITQFNEAASGSGFIDAYNTNTLGVQTLGLQNTAGDQALLYRRVNPDVYGGPLFGSDLAIAYGPNSNVLPVELTSFYSSVSGSNVTLNWSTSSEINNMGYDIERAEVSVQHWIKVGNVSGNGTSNEAHNYSFKDKNLPSGNYSYRLKQIDFNGSFEYFNLSNEVNIGVPDKFSISQNYPNPFNPVTKVNYDIPFDSKVNIRIFDISGKEVMNVINEVKPAGYYSVNINGSNLSSGIYFYRITAEGNGLNYVNTKKMTLIK